MCFAYLILVKFTSVFYKRLFQNMEKRLSKPKNGLTKSTNPYPMGVSVL
jgi:hypothetical protein